LTLRLLLLVWGLCIPGLRDLLSNRILDDARLCLEVRPGRRAAAYFFFGPVTTILPRLITCILLHISAGGLVRLVDLRDIDPRSLDYASFLILELL